MSRLTMKMPEDVHKKIKILSALRGQSMVRMLEDLVDAELSKYTIEFNAEPSTEKQDPAAKV